MDLAENCHDRRSDVCAGGQHEEAIRGLAVCAETRVRGYAAKDHCRGSGCAFKEALRERFAPPCVVVVVGILTDACVELVEPYLPETYRACEIFGRNLTEGWFTWGDEALKFNWDGHWGEG